MKKLGIIGIGNWGKNLIRDASKISYVKKCSSQGNPKNIYVWDDHRLYKNNKKSSSFRLVFESRHTPLETECKEFIKKLNETKISFESAYLAKDVIQVIQKLK